MLDFSGVPLSVSAGILKETIKMAISISKEKSKDYKFPMLTSAASVLAYPRNEKNRFYIKTPWGGVLRITYSDIMKAIVYAMAAYNIKIPADNSLSGLIKQLTYMVSNTFDWQFTTPKLGFMNGNNLYFTMLKDNDWVYYRLPLSFQEIAEGGELVWQSQYTFTPNAGLDPEFMCPMAWLDTPFRPPKEPENWLKFINRILPSEKLQHILQEFVGISLIPWINPQRALILIGPGANGKTTLLSALKYILGDRYVSALNIKDLSNNTLMGTVEDSVLNISEENITIERLIDSNAFKAIVGESTVMVNPKYQPPYFITPRARWILAVNDFPQFSETSKAIVRRLLFLPMTVTIPVEERKPMPEILDSFKDERIDIIFWFLEGAKRFIKNNYQFTGSVVSNELIDRWKKNNSTVAYWLYNDNLSSGEYSSRTLYAYYKQWCYDSGFKPKSIRNFVRELKELGVEHKHTKSGNIFIIDDDFIEIMKEDLSYDTVDLSWDDYSV